MLAGMLFFVRKLKFLQRRSKVFVDVRTIVLYNLVIYIRLAGQSTNRQLLEEG